MDGIYFKRVTRLLVEVSEERVIRMGGWGAMTTYLTAQTNHQIMREFKMFGSSRLAIHMNTNES